ncbi:hypothetical protein PPS11_29971 [Pseudomonas putida S11]|nr:hypothetical protein PPS11_29971 [Pseudomonas putida S11]
MHRRLLAQRQGQVTLHRQVITRPGHVDLPGAQRLFVTGLAHWPPQATLQHLGQLAVAVIRQVQHAYHRNGEAGRQRAQHTE